MAGDLAAKQSRAEELREELRVLRIQRTVDVQEADAVGQEAKLDTEIEQLEQQVAIARIQAENGGSVTEAMDAMAAAAKLEEENAARAEEAAAPVDDAVTKGATEVAEAPKDEPVPVNEEAPAPLMMGLTNPGGNV